jgi:hypothetical protein
MTFEHLWRRRIVLIGIVLATTALTSCGFGQDQVSGRVGETLTAGDYELLVSGIENPAERPDRFTNPQIGNRFVNVTATVTNRGQQYLPLAASHFNLKDTGGIDNPAKPGVPSDTGLKATSLSPGQKMDLQLYFEMAANQSPVELTFTPQVVGWRTRITVDVR